MHLALDETQTVVTFRPTWPNVLDPDHNWEMLFDEVWCTHCDGAFKEWEHYAAARLYELLTHVTNPYGEVPTSWLN